MPAAAALLVYDFFMDVLFKWVTDQQILFDTEDEFESLYFTNINVDLL